MGRHPTLPKISEKILDDEAFDNSCCIGRERGRSALAGEADVVKEEVVGVVV